MSDIFRKEYRKLDKNQIGLIEVTKEKAQHLYDQFEAMIELSSVDNRMMALAKTNLEQAIMWAIKSIT